MRLGPHDALYLRHFGASGYSGSHLRTCGVLFTNAGKLLALLMALLLPGLPSMAAAVACRSKVSLLCAQHSTPL